MRYWARRHLRAVASWARQHPFLTTFIILSIWLTALSYATYWVSRSDQARARRQRAAIVAEANQQICRAINVKVLQPARLAQDSSITNTAKLLHTLGFTDGQVKAFTAQQKIRAAANKARFADIDCSKLATAEDGFAPKPLPPVTVPTVATATTGATTTP